MYENAVETEPLLYGDFMSTNVDNKQYTRIDDHKKVCPGDFLKKKERKIERKRERKA